MCSFPPTHGRRSLRAECVQRNVVSRSHYVRNQEYGVTTPALHVPQKIAKIGNQESAESAHMCRSLARQCELHSARISAEWREASFLFPP